MIVAGGGRRSMVASAPSASCRSFSSFVVVEVSESEEIDGERDGAGEERDVSESEREGIWLSVDGVVSRKGPLVRFRLRAIMDDIVDDYWGDGTALQWLWKRLTNRLFVGELWPSRCHCREVRNR